MTNKEFLRKFDAHEKFTEEEIQDSAGEKLVSKSRKTFLTVDRGCC